MTAPSTSRAANAVVEAGSGQHSSGKYLLGTPMFFLGYVEEKTPIRPRGYNWMMIVPASRYSTLMAAVPILGPFAKEAVEELWHRYRKMPITAETWKSIETLKSRIHRMDQEIISEVQEKRTEEHYMKELFDALIYEGVDIDEKHEKMYVLYGS